MTGENEIVGREGLANGDADPTGAVALRIALVNPTSSTDAQLLAEQFLVFDHGDDGNLFDSELVLKAAEAGGLVELELKVTRTDGDDDEAVGMDTIDLISETTSPFAYDDDGPQAAIVDTGVMVVHDESAGEQNGSPLSIVLAAGIAMDGSDDLATLGAVTTDTFEINGVAVFEYTGLAGGTTVGELVTAVNAAMLPQVGSAAIVPDGGGLYDLILTAAGSGAFTLGGQIATDLSVSGPHSAEDTTAEDNNDDDQAGTLPVEFTGLGTAIGWAKSASAVVTSRGYGFRGGRPGKPDFRVLVALSI